MRKIEEIKSKNFLRSKTLWVGLIVAILPWLESAQDFASSPGTISLIGLIIIVLRFLTKEAVSI
jgi:hypothetical protein